MSSAAAPTDVTVSIVGGGLAGLAAAVALAEAGCRVALFEARSSLGGRAGSFRESGDEWVDHCQHVSMGCCTNLADFCRRVGIAQYFRQDRVLNFVGPDGRIVPFAANGLPAPLHLASSFWRLKYLSVLDRLRIARAMWKLMRMRISDDWRAPTIGHWLLDQRQSPRAIEYFWNVILVSALGEQLDRASLSAARKVIVDGFLAAREAYVVEVPTVPLGALYGEHLEQWFAARGVQLNLGTQVRKVSSRGGPAVELSDGRQVRSDYVIVAVPWHKVGGLVDASLAGRWPWLAEIGDVPGSPITGVHLWFDRAIMPLEHAVLIGRLSQWVFRRAWAAAGSSEHYYQVVVSASRSLAGRSHETIVAEVCEDLRAIWPQARAARLLRSRVVTQPSAVFSVRPGLDQVRPKQMQGDGILVAGDWTATGWPATMEGAVRSGYLAAEAVLQAAGRPGRVLVDDLPRGRLAERLLAKEL